MRRLFDNRVGIAIVHRFTLFFSVVQLYRDCCDENTNEPINNIVMTTQWTIKFKI